MPFGLKNAGMTFQWHMDQIFNGLDFAFIYIDDILVASKSIRSTWYTSGRSSSS